MAMLLIQKGYNQGAVFRLGERSLTIGRDPGNLVQIIDDKVSRRHALVRWSGKGYTVQDLHSHNGLFVNDARVDLCPIDVGDLIQVGGTTLEVVPDRAGVLDSTLGRKVVDKSIAAAATSAFSFAGSQPHIEQDGFTINLDKTQEQRELGQNMFLYDLDRLCASTGQVKAAMDRATGGIGEMLAPDRCFILRVSPEGKAQPAAAGYAADLTAERKRARPAVVAITTAFKRKKPIILNQLPADPADRDPLGSAAVVPIVNAAGTTTGLLYLDSFADNPQAYIEEDLDLLRQVATRLAKVL